MSTATRNRSDRRAEAEPEPMHVDPVVSAKEAGLRYVSDESPGFGRRPSGKAFTYLGLEGKPIRDPEAIRRIRSLVIPPAWADVWICPRADGHLQATGRDARGRKQYRYHPRWRSVRDETKYGRMMAFGRALPVIRKRVDADLAQPGLPREKVLATIVRLLEMTLIRVGNEEYARTNGSFGLTTMRDRHVKAGRGALTFAFKGKSGVKHAIDLADKRIARVVQKCRDLPGQTLFQYLDESGERHTIDSADVNDYLRDVSGHDFTAKDFRTWAGTVLAAQALAAIERFKSNSEAKRNVVKAIESVAKRLGNTKAVCRKCYIHPAIFDAYMDGATIQTIKLRARVAKTRGALNAEESAVVGIIEHRLRRKTA